MLKYVIFIKFHDKSLTNFLSMVKWIPSYFFRYSHIFQKLFRILLSMKSTSVLTSDMTENWSHFSLKMGFNSLIHIYFAISFQNIWILWHLQYYRLKMYAGFIWIWTPSILIFHPSFLFVNTIWKIPKMLSIISWSIISWFWFTKCH